LEPVSLGSIRRRTTWRSGVVARMRFFHDSLMAAVRGRLSSLPGLENARVYHLAYSRHPFTW
jgi:hypothetical protein